ncbi:hypothetical protein Acav_2622 [Paracidovorax avenae ATCC 19860]|uniref:Uncharacterized protein n=1 Tax=Paracidovorax avenae (strain ATCC 19860 / DSM 7227 / CCUG 15838 / JCM 20985 / LMG 2117 / NCPPB 1011) TaxID=643561 RepID=F0Q1K9_PARA1|nr:hypothetical protein [Paracidovorax avenae]ADX46534.1 hypothetical protein Acav_2622 [Paracidovorax avenae ATCC 19860]
MSLRKDYFDLQWRFARHYAEAAHLPLDQAIARCTNLRRRMNLWGPAGASRWEAFLSTIRASGPDLPPGFHLYMAFQEGEPPPPRPRTFGCFSHDSPDPSGVLRIHFMPPPGIDRSPLAFASMADRMDELRALFRQVRQEHPHARSVRGISWLYHLAAYRRLFPPQYGHSARPADFPLHLTGSSTWGQVLDWRQHVKPAMRDAVLSRMAEVDPQAPWKVFPCQPLVASCGIGHFHDWFA